MNEMSAIASGFIIGIQVGDIFLFSNHRRWELHPANAHVFADRQRVEKSAALRNHPNAKCATLDEWWEILEAEYPAIYFNDSTCGRYARPHHAKRYCEVCDTVKTRWYVSSTSRNELAEFICPACMNEKYELAQDGN